MHSVKSPLKCGVEGPIDEIVLKRILEDVGLPGAEFYGKKGKQYLVNQLPKYNRSARHLTWVVLLDLDRDAECAPGYVSRPTLKQRFSIWPVGVAGGIFERQWYRRPVAAGRWGRDIWRVLQST